MSVRFVSETTTAKPYNVYSSTMLRLNLYSNIFLQKTNISPELNLSTTVNMFDISVNIQITHLIATAFHIIFAPLGQPLSLVFLNISFRLVYIFHSMWYSLFTHSILSRIYIYSNLRNFISDA